MNAVYGIWQSNDDAHSWTMIGDYPTGSLDQIKTVSGDPTIYGQVYVGFSGSGYAYLPAASLTAPVDHAPVVTVSNQTVTHNQAIAASSLFTATDPDGDTITTYGLKDVTGNGHFVVNGVVQASNTEIDLTAAQLAQTTYVAGLATDQLSIRASDGTLWSGWQAATVTVPADQAPVVTVSNQTVTHNQSIAASSLFTATDPDGDTIITYALKDVTGNGRFVVSGVVQATNVEIDLTAAQLAQTTYQSGSGSDQLAVRAFDGTIWSGWQTVTVTAPTDQAPVVTVSNQTVTHNQSIAASSLFTATDPDGDIITSYALKDVTGNGHFVVNGVVQASNTEIDLTAAQLALTTYAAGSGSDQLSVRAFDGTLWSGWQTVTVTVPADQAPVVTAANQTVRRSQSIAASSLFTATDPEGDTITTYGLKDVTGSGHFVVNGVVQAANVEIDLTAAQLAQTTYVAGSATDQLSIRASDGTLWSGWQTVTATVPANQAPVAKTSNKKVSSTQSIAASSLLTASDPDGDAITSYGFQNTGNGRFVLNGVTQGNNQEIDVTAAQLSQLAYQSTGGTDALQVRVSDGTLWSGWQNFTVTGPVTTSIETFGSTNLTEVANTFYLYSNSDGFGPSMRFGGAAFVAGQFGAWTPIGVEATASGYQVALKVTGADQYGIWFTDRSGNYVKNSSVMSGTSTALESLENSFHQDLNGDGVIGIPGAVAIEAAGSTGLTKAANNFYLYSNSDESGPSLKFGGVAVAANALGAWMPLGVEATAAGYQVALKTTGADQYGIWFTDSSGNYIKNSNVMSGTSTALELLENSFHQDLNGDGVVGLPGAIEASGSTGLTRTGNNFYLDSNSDGSGPSLKFGGAAFAAGQFGAWTPIGVEATASGYQVALKVAGADQYGIWFTDSSGNHVKNSAVMSGTSTAMESWENSFHQDLNGDGVVGIPGAMAIETSGSTGLTKAANNFYLYSNSDGSGPSLKFGGAAFAAGQFGAWTPIGVEATTSGYQIALQVTGADQFGIWFTDSSGNYIKNSVVMSGTSAALESLETSFHQDLNGDGVVGLAVASPTVNSLNSNQATVAAGATVELGRSSATSVLFADSTGTLKFDDSSSFTGTVAGLNGQDTLDLADINFANIQQLAFSGTSSGGKLSVTDGTGTANITLLGNYMASTFVASSDGFGGTFIVDAQLAYQSNMLTNPH